MASETADSHLITTSDEQTVKLSSEAVKAAEKINISSPEESVEDGKADKLQAPDFILSTSEEKAKDIQIDPPVIELKKTDETPVVDIPIHNDVKLEKEPIPDKSPPEGKPSTSTESVGEKTTESPVITSLEENLKVGDSTENIKSPPEEHPIPKFVAREALEVPATGPTEKVQEPIPEAVDVLKLEVKSSDYTVDNDNQAKEQPAVGVQPVTGVPEEQEILLVPAEKVEEKQPQIVDNPELSVVPTADSGKDPATEQPVVSVEKEELEKASVPVLSVAPPKKEEVLPAVELIEKGISELVEPPKKEEEKLEVLPVNESVEVIAKEISELVESPKKEEEKCEVLPANEPVVVIAKEITELVEPPKKEEEKIEVVPANEPVEVIAKEIHELVEPVIKQEQPIEVHPVKESGEVIAKEISEPIDVPKGKEQASEVLPVLEAITKNIREEDHPAKELVVVVKEIGESIEPPKNNEQPDAVLPKKESEEVIAKEISARETPKDEEQSDEGFPVIESGEVKGKETIGSALVSVELEKQEPEVSPPLRGEQIHKEEAQYTVESAKQDSQPGSTTDSGKGQANKQPDTEFVSLEKEPKEESEKTPVPELFVEPPKIEVLPVKGPEEVIAKEAAETTEPPVKKEQPIDEVHPVKGTEPNKADEKIYEKIEESNQPTEEEAAKGSSTAAEVAEKSVDDKKTDKEDALIAETKIEESTKDEKQASVETGNAEHVEEKHNVIIEETPKELQEPEVEIKDKETVITGVDNPDSTIQNKEPSGDEIKLSQNLQKEVPSKPTHKHSNNILSKVKQSLVKAKKAIIGKSPNSKTISSEARDDIKVK